MLQLTTINGQDGCFQPVFDGKTFASFDGYGNSIEYAENSVCNTSHSLSWLSMQNIDNMISSLSSIVLTLIANKNISTPWNIFANITTNHIIMHILDIK